MAEEETALPMALLQEKLALLSANGPATYAASLHACVVYITDIIMLQHINMLNLQPASMCQTTHTGCPYFNTRTCTCIMYMYMCTCMYMRIKCTEDST